MKIQVQVKPRAAKNMVEKVDDHNYRVWVTALPHKGEANEAVIELLATHFKVPKSSVQIRLGTRGKKKLVEID